MVVFQRILISVCCSFAALSLLAESSLDAAQKPNIVFFLVDDLGWADISPNGSSYHQTPNLEKLAKSGVRFTNAYAAASICSPTRASILTGKHPVRVNITDWIPGAKTPAKAKFLHVDDLSHLPLEEVTLAEVLKQNDYQTFFAGKWHLGGEGHLPTDQGFDTNIGGFHVGSPPGGYYSPWKNPHLKAKRDGEYVTERLTEESIKFIEDRNKQQPFLLYLSYYNIHTPITPYKKRIEEYQQAANEKFKGPTPTQKEHEGVSRMRQDNPALASMVAAVDDSVGEILKTLTAQGLDENTIVVFFSDNGGLCTTRGMGPGCNLPLRSGKGWLYEGGIREPMIIRAPKIAAGVCDTPVISMDFFPTLLELAGIPLQAKLHADGQSLVPLLKQQGDFPERTLCWHYPHYHGSTWKPGAAIRKGDWKLIEFYEYDQVELYNLKEDLGESKDLAKDNPSKLKELREELKAWQTSMKAQMPQPNPNYDPNQGTQPTKNKKASPK